MFKVLHSSAGAGKTHALVKHYLMHCLRTSDHGAYRHVLALTFTNKAAAEMKERVISYLEGLAKGSPFDGALADVAGQLMRDAGIDEQELARRAEVVLGHMLHHWSDVAISTIDAFTRRVVKPFARDLRLDQDLRMTTEQDHYRQEAVNTLIDRTGSDERTTELLTLTCLQLLHEERPWDPTKPLMELSRELLNERSIGPLVKLRGRSLDELTALMERLNVATAQFRRKVQAIGREAAALFEQQGLHKGDIAYKGAILGYFHKLAAFTGEWGIPSSHVRSPIDTGKWHSGKADAAAIAALQGVADRATALFQEAERLREEGLAHYRIQQAVARELLPAFALHGIDATLEELKHEDGVAFFSDLTRRVAEVVKDEPVPFIYERLGERYRHFLIDEFQDTSVLQWNALLPLIDHALSTGGSVLLVGDAKQAIYRWRNGEVRLFVELPKLFGMDREDEAQVQRENMLGRTFRKGDPLTHNRRSAQRVIAFNNALFGTLPDLLTPELRKVYDGQAQESWRADPGTVRITVDKKEKETKGAKEEKDEKEETDVKDAGLVATHALDSLKEAMACGYGPGDVAVLVRSKRVGRTVAGHLLAHGFAVVSPDGLQLAADPAVQLLVECLRFIVQGDDVSAARALQWQAIVAGADAPHEFIGWSIPLNTSGWPDAARTLNGLLAQHRATALRTTLAALVEGIARCFGLRPADDSALLTFMDEVHTWSTGHTQDIDGFLEHWERTGGDRSNAAPDGADAVQVMTVHKSKGLQFPVVIVPDARMGSTRTHGELLWVAPGDAVPELDTALVRESKILRDNGLPELEEEQAMRDLDALNLLYVAFTRAEQQLYAFVPKAWGRDPVTVALTAFVNAQPQLAHTPLEPAPERKPKPAQDTWTLRDVATPEAGVPWEIRTEGGEAEAARAGRIHGTTVHAILASISTAAGLPGALALAVARGDLDADEAGELNDRLTPMLQGPTLHKWFADGADVRSEAAIIDADGHSRRPDRIAQDTDGLHVLEIKTGKAAKKHEEQLQGYLELLRTMGHPHVTGTLWYLADGELRSVA